MAVIDLYTRRVLGPREIEERAAYQPQTLGEDWSIADDMVDHDLASLLRDVPSAPNRDDPTPPNNHDSAIERYARWMAIGHHEQARTKTGFRADNRHNDPINNPSKPITTRHNTRPETPKADVRAERETLHREIERARLTQTADELRGAAERLRDLANSLRQTRDKLYQHNQSRDRVRDRDHRS